MQIFLCECLKLLLANHLCLLNIYDYNRIRNLFAFKDKVRTKRDQQSRDILVTFVSNNAKSQFMMSRKKLKGSGVVYVNEDLTRARALLFSQPRSLKQQKQIEDTWTMTGAIFVKLFDGNIRKVVSGEHY
ncbi:hypothetical protein LSH36_121g13042 [Paralvinella palmiformis]|uniref:Uncharacterized protein n=1 Tax=Paralvinella palmiformis TaxID=53620 RepID=A0AAD9N8U7_9ANNE|nr:hypothetical protein LSH36_121g13042 [Paralvinella palmiformis]